MKHSMKWWVSLLACAAVFWAGLICLVMSLDSGDAVPVQMAARDLTITPVASPDRPDDWRDWYEVRYTLENQSDRSLSLDAYDLVYTEGGDTLYPWSDDANTALSARPVLPAGCSVEVCHLLYVEEGQSARVKLRYDSWDARSDVLLEFELGE